MLKNILCEIGVIIALLIILLIVGDSEVVELLSCGDAGRVIGSFGIIWGIAAFVRLSTGWGEWSLSLLCAIGCIIFGLALNMEGFFTAVFVIGIYSLILAWVMLQVCEYLALKFLIAGLIMCMIGYPLRKFSTPTKYDAVDAVPEQLD